MQKEFQLWYADEIAKTYNAYLGAVIGEVDISTARMKSIGVSWLVQLYDHLVDNPFYVVNGFDAAGILQSIDACKPMVTNKKDQNDLDSDTEDDEEDCSDESSCTKDEEFDNENIRNCYIIKYTIHSSL